MSRVVFTLELQQPYTVRRGFSSITAECLECSAGPSALDDQISHVSQSCDFWNLHSAHSSSVAVLCQAFHNLVLCVYSLHLAKDLR